jgi:hypothetical protein
MDEMPHRTLVRYKCDRCSKLYANPDQLFIIDLRTWEWADEGFGLRMVRETPWVLCARCAVEKTSVDKQLVEA